VSDHFDLDLSAARVTFSTRRGGVSEGPYESLNLGLWTDDDADRIRENRRRLQRHAGAESIGHGRQVHGVELREWTGPPAEGDPPEVDGHLTRERDLGLLVLTADCLPVALAGREQVAMLHCGWRGLAGGIIGRALERFDEPPAAAIGPGIGPCCYEVGEEVAAALGRSGESHLDLRAIAREQLAEASAVVEVDLCTSCHPELFFSHRRDGGVTGRQAGMVVLDGG
jgi:YfiH family protein